MVMYNDSHMVEVPKAFWGIKIAQLVIAVLVLALGCFAVAVTGTGGYEIFVSLFTIGILIYYFVAVHSQPKSYNWIALLVLECVTVIFWLVQWALVATVVGIVDAYYGPSGDFAVGYVLLALGLVEWALYITTLVLFGKGIHQHRKAGRPMDADGTSSSFNMASQQEKHNMQPMPANQTYYSPDQQQQPIQHQHQFQPQQQPNPQYYANEAPVNNH